MANGDNTPNILQRSIQRFAATSLGSKLFIPTAHRLDRIVLRLSNGRNTMVGLTAGLPVITLTTIGAKSGQLRSVPLIGIPDGHRYVLIASNFGQTHHPAWYYNLRQHPQATITLLGSTSDYVATEASGEEYDRLWQKAVSLYGGYAAYKTRTGGRAIPIIILAPEPSGRAAVTVTAAAKTAL